MTHHNSEDNSAQLKYGLSQNKKKKIIIVSAQRIRIRSGRFVVQILGWSNRTQYCQRLATAETFH